MKIELSGKLFKSIQELDKFTQALNAKLLTMEQSTTPVYCKEEKKELLTETVALLSGSKAYAKEIYQKIGMCTGSITIFVEHAKLDSYLSDDIINKDCIVDFHNNTFLLSEYIELKDPKDISCLTKCIENIDDSLTTLKSLGDNFQRLHCAAQDLLHKKLFLRIKECNSCCYLTQKYLMLFKETWSPKTTSKKELLYSLESDSSSDEYISDIIDNSFEDSDSEEEERDCEKCKEEETREEIELLILLNNKYDTQEHICTIL
ncbi:hypothetical protein AB837_00567 [bacterium AB1]|nr:hypothetical protein AB837_00567 [bacterium AB1]